MGGMVIQAPWSEPFPGCRWFDNLVDGTVNNNTITLLSFTVPNSSKGIIKWFGNKVCGTNNSDDITWKLEINGAVDTVYGSIIGEIAEIKNPIETFIYIPIGAKVELKATSTIAEDRKVIGRLVGWTWVDYDGVAKSW